ncbi:MAG TPA: DUF2325 domain-containing protein [Sulfuricurvum sp.]|nr:MAG: hypothetical protein B7Y30_04835 [Campylobacterales bacterium 16-40-21]OZA02564.1 MAG: hypothetical protein B7X89_08895 [Sulfuricurvum sp. 17-40-25]HQS66825.1 DUF2325 domain-containing protein [Sulfuricurvum sp.]HQT36046.1 DUF2325 domain-containing protein [Sulfuricurvum sp.]
MSVLVIGGDKITRLQHFLKSIGAKKTYHWNSRNKSTTHKHLPQKTDMLIMMTDFLNHNAMHDFKRQAKKSAIPFICVKGMSGCNECEIKKLALEIQLKNDR